MAPSRGKSWKFSEEVEQEVTRRYAQGELSGDLAKEIGCSIHTIRNMVRRQGDTVFPRGNRHREFSEEEIAEMGRLWDEGLSQYALARRFGSSQPTVGRVLRDAGYKPKRRKAEGARHGAWKGGKVGHRSGYWQIKVWADHPFYSMANREGYILEHRLLMAQALGRPLASNEHVHHKNGDRKDNRLENLQLIQGKHGRGVVATCRQCGSHDVVFEDIVSEEIGG